MLSSAYAVVSYDDIKSHKKAVSEKPQTSSPLPQPF